MESVSIDLERQKKAKEYARARRRMVLVDLILGIVYIAAWLVFGWSAGLRNTLEQLTPNVWVVVLAFGAVFGAGYYAIGLPFAFYSGFILPHRFGQSNQSLRGWIREQIKSLPIALVLGGVILEVVYAILRTYPQTWWLWAAAFFLVFNVLLANLAPVLLMPLFNRYVPLDSEHADLADRLLGLAERTGTRVQGVYKFDISRRTKSANAALAGLWKTRRIILGDTLLEKFEQEEIEAIVAHELGHNVHWDIPVGIALESILTLGGLYAASIGLDWGAQVMGFDGPADIAALPVFAAIFILYELVTMPLINAYSRWRERRADRFAIQVTGNGAAMASALTRLANQNLADIDPEPWVEFFLHSHPALKKRIEMARAAPNFQGEA